MEMMDYNSSEAKSLIPDCKKQKLSPRIDADQRGFLKFCKKARKGGHPLINQSGFWWYTAQQTWQFPIQKLVRN